MNRVIRVLACLALDGTIRQDRIDPRDARSNKGRLHQFIGA